MGKQKALLAAELRAPEPPPETEAMPRNLTLQIPAEGDRSTTLAPEEQSSWGRGSLDPAEWLAAVQAGGIGGTGQAAVTDPGSALTPAHRPELPELVEGWVRRVALGGDQRRAVARLDIGHGRYAGAELVVSAEAGQVSVELTLPEGAPSEGLSRRLTERLTSRGYSADVSVR